MNIWTKIDAIVCSINLIAVRDDDDARGSQSERVPKTFLFPAKKVAGERSAPWHGTKEDYQKISVYFCERRRRREGADLCEKRTI